MSSVLCRWILCSAWLAWQPAAHGAAEPGQRMHPRALSGELMQQLEAGRIRQGFDLLRPHWPLPARELDSVVRETEAGWPGVRLRLGEPGPSEFVAEHRLTPALVRFVYRQRFSRGGAEWHITFVQAGGTWRVDGLSFHEMSGIAPQ